MKTQLSAGALFLSIVLVLSFAGQSAHAGAREDLISCLQKITGSNKETEVTACYEAWKARRAEVKANRAQENSSSGASENEVSTIAKSTNKAPPDTGSKVKQESSSSINGRVTSDSSASDSPSSKEKFNLQSCMDNKYTKSSPDNFVKACCAHLTTFKANSIQAGLISVGVSEIARKNSLMYCERNTQKCIKSLCR